jgi:ABC-type phosphate transport system substrate-binding protein
MTHNIQSTMHRIVAAALISAPLFAHAGVAVVVGAKSPAGKLSADQVSQLFLGKSTSLPGAGTAVLLDQSEGSAVRDAFYEKATGKNPAQAKAVWSRLVFSGAAQAPKALPSGAEVKKAVAANPDAIGYIDSSEVDASVKVLFSAD